MKMGPRWSRTIYEITKVRGTTGIPEYRVRPLEDDNGNPIVADGDEHKPSQQKCVPYRPNPRDTDNGGARRAEGARGDKERGHMWRIYSKDDNVMS
jgi:hypothetical protein